MMPGFALNHVTRKIDNKIIQRKQKKNSNRKIVLFFFVVVCSIRNYAQTRRILKMHSIDLESRVCTSVYIYFNKMNNNN